MLEQALAILPAQSQSPEMIAQMEMLAERANLFTSLHLPVVGVPSLIAGILPQSSPVNNLIFPIDNPFLAFFFTLLFTGIGFVLTAVFLHVIAGIIRQEPFHLLTYLRRFVVSTGHFVGLAMLFVIALLIIGMVMLPVLLIASAIHATIAGIIIFLTLMFSMWVAIYLGFSIHDIYLNETPFWSAMFRSFLFVRYYLIPATGMFISIYTINYLMTILWQLAETGSWFTLISIFGHAFISTALIIATFIFFQDRIGQLPESPIQFTFIKRSQ
jgi:hypothetical protein